MITLDQALALLERMQDAAPAATASKLAEIAALLQSVSDDNAYLVGLYGEALILPVADQPPQPAEPGAPPPPPPPRAHATPADGDILLQRLTDRLRSPVQRADELAATLAAGSVGMLTPEQDAIARQITENTGCALATLDAVQQLATLRQGAVEIMPLVFSAAMLLREVERLVQDRVQAREQALTIVYPNTELRAVADYQRILVLVVDLVDNASRYTPPGGAIRLSAETLGTHVLFTIADSGIGLTEEDLEHVGEPFWRATNQPLVSQHCGTGLRLYLARQLLPLQGGDLIFSGEPGVGSTFSFTLPVAR